MSKELIERLRADAESTDDIGLCADAADRIEELERKVASRDAEIAELVGVLGNVTAHLVAAHSLLSSGGKKAAASDTIFKIMLQDYEKSFEAGRKALARWPRTRRPKRLIRSGIAAAVTAPAATNAESATNGHR